MRWRHRQREVHPCLKFLDSKKAFKSCQHVAIAYGSQKKIQNFNGVWTRDLAIPVRNSNQLNYESNDVGIWSFMASNQPVRNEWMMMKWYISEMYGNIVFLFICAVDRQNTASHPQKRIPRCGQKLFYVQIIWRESYGDSIAYGQIPWLFFDI